MLRSFPAHPAPIQRTGALSVDPWRDVRIALPKCDVGKTLRAMQIVERPRADRTRTCRWGSRRSKCHLSARQLRMCISRVAELAMPPSRQGPLGALAAQRVRKANDRICPKTRCIGRGFRCFGAKA